MGDIDKAAAAAAEKLKVVAREAAQELHETTAATEAERQQAEAVRQEQEKRRQNAEGGDNGDELQETGRVEAEGERVSAEDMRVLRDKRLLPRISVLVALPLALIALTPSVIGLVLLHREVSHRCHDTALNRAAIRDTVLGGLPGIGAKATNNGGIVKAGTPTVAYWRDHPGERDKAITNARNTLGRFPGIGC